MILSRELGKRIWGGSTNMENGGGGVSSDAIAGLLTGYAKESWVDGHYISIDFFSRLFQAHGTENGSEIDVMPNDMETTITSVESMFGFWTNLYISALGSNGAAPAGISLGMLTDVNISGTPSAGQVLTFDAVTQKWVNGNAQAGATALANLTDVTLTSLQTNQILIYDANTQKWVNSSVKTINGYSIFGTGDIPASGGGTGSYLSIYGGQMYGNVYSDYIGLAFASNNAYIRISSSSSSYDGFIARNGDGMCFGAENFSKGLVVDMETGKARFTHNIAIGGYTNPYFLLYNYGATYSVNGYDCNADTGYSMAGIIILRYNGNDSGLKSTILSAGGNGIYIRPNGSTNSSGQSVFKNNGYVGVNTDSPSYTLHVVGTIYATGAITALSDARKKDIVGEAGVTVEQIAHAPAVQFLWKDKERRKDGQQVGTLAQYWQTVLPEVVSDKGGELSMQYGVAALVSAIITARKVVDHERRITELEKENERLKEEISQLRLN